MKKIKFKREEERWQDNPIAQLLIFTPAVVFSSILMVPCVILSLPLLLLPKKIQKLGMKLLLILQNTISLSFWYFIGQFIFPGVIELPMYVDYLIVLIGVYFGFIKTINKNVNETLEKQGYL